MTQWPLALEDPKSDQQEPLPVECDASVDRLLGVLWTHKDPELASFSLCGPRAQHNPWLAPNGWLRKVWVVLMRDLRVRGVESEQGVFPGPRRELGGWGRVQ